MNPSNKLYVPDPSLWITYFRRKKRVEQRGGGGMIPIVEEKEKQPSVDKVNVKLVSPVEAATDRVGSAIKRIKRKRKRNTLSRGINCRGRKSPHFKRKTTKNRKSSTVSKKRKSLKKDIFN